MISGVVLDTSACLAFAQGKVIYAQAVVFAAVADNRVLAASAAAVADAWALVDEHRRMDLRVLLGLPVTVVDPVDPVDAEDLGAWMATAGILDLAAAHTVHTARRRAWPVLTAEPARLHRIDPTLPVEELP